MKLVKITYIIHQHEDHEQSRTHDEQLVRLPHGLMSRMREHVHELLLVALVRATTPAVAAQAEEAVFLLTEEGRIRRTATLATPQRLGGHLEGLL